MQLKSNPDILATLKEMGQGFTLTLDPVFKMVFGLPECEGILASMLNAVLGGELDTPIEQLWFQPQEYASTNIDGRTCHMDIVARDQAGRLYDVEMQRTRDAVFNDRLLLYVSRLVTHYTPGGTKEVELQKVVGLSFGEQALPGLEECPSPYVVVRVDTDQPGYRLRGALPKTLHVNLPLVRLAGRATEAKDFDARLAWCYYVAMEGSEMEEKERRKVSEVVSSYPDIEKARRRYIESLLTDNEALQLGMLQELNAAWKAAGAISTAWNEALAEGHAQGLQQGIEEGIEQGREQGLQEGLLNGKLETARALKTSGVDLGIIADSTGLDKGRIEAL
ncbi:MAG: PD-(D/E)XK nuclease family transposase [Sphaerochaetaceae bacterium]|nr:PD-(D/E)XK nuclease family transposase [Sphaerochaetaceae bacterium]